MQRSLIILLFLAPAPLFASQIWTTTGVCDTQACNLSGVTLGTVVDFTLELADGTITSGITFDKNDFISLTAILDPLGAATAYDFTFDLSISPSTFLWDASSDYLFVQTIDGQLFCSDTSGSGCSTDFDGLVEWSGNNKTGPLIAGNTAALDWQLQPVPVPAAVWLFGSALGLLGWMRRKSA